MGLTSPHKRSRRQQMQPAFTKTECIMHQQIQPQSRSDIAGFKPLAVATVSLAGPTFGKLLGHLTPQIDVAKSNTEQARMVTTDTKTFH